VKFLIDRPVATAMAFCALLILGVYSYLQTPLELEPKEDYPQVTISVSWPGVSPEVVQTRVTAPLEEAASAVKAVRGISSSSETGMSRVVVDFDSKADMEFVQLALREELSKLRPVLPPGLRPAVTPFVPEDFRVNPFLRYTVSGTASLQELRGLIKDRITFGLGSVRGVSRVVLTGGSDPEFRIVPDRAKLDAYGLQPYEIIRAVSGRLGIYPSGRVRDGNRELLFKYGDQIRDKNDLAETIVGSAGGNVLRVRDVAAVDTTWADVDSIHRINGRPTVSFTVHKEKGTNTMRVARDVKAKLALIRKDLPPDLVFQVVDDESRDIKKSLGDLYRLAGLITIVVFLMIFLILRRIGPSLLILASIAFSVVITFNLIAAFGISLNMLTLGALALGFGMFVDNSIVVFENILRLRENGLPPREAAVRGPREVFTAVLSSTLTTIAVFFSFPFFQGRLKIYYLPLAFVIGSALAASLLVSFTLIPALSPRLLKWRREETARRPEGIFGRFLRACLRHPVEVMLVAAVVFIGSYRWFKAEVRTGEWFSFTSRQYLFVYLGLPPGTDIERTDAAIKPFEDFVLAQACAKEMNVQVSPTSATLRVSFPPAIERSAIPYRMKEELIRTASQFAGLDVYVYGFDPQMYGSSMGPGSFLDSKIRFFGYNLKKLKEITAEVEKTLRLNPRIQEVMITSNRHGWWGRGSSIENILKIDPERLRAYDVDPRFFYGYLQTLLQGRFGAPLVIRTEGKEMAAAVKFPDADILDLRGVKDALIRTRGGEYLRLGEVADLIERPSAGSIDRDNRRFQQTVSWEFRGPVKAGERFRTSLFAGLHLPAGFSASLDDDRLMTVQERSQILQAAVISLLVIFMIIAALFESLTQPFIIMLAVPLGLIGVFLAFILAGATFDSSAYIGVILLAGIVVNNAILLVDHINLKRKRGRPLIEAAVEGARERIRPILMTTGTTVFGILPMLLLPVESGKMRIWSSLALCTAGGLVTSALFLLIVVPIVYVQVDHLRRWAAAWWSRIRSRPS